MLIPNRDEIAGKFAELAEAKGFEATSQDGHVTINAPVGEITIDVGAEYTRVALDGESKGGFHNSSESRNRAMNVVGNMLG